MVMLNTPDTLVRRFCQFKALLHLITLVRHDLHSTCCPMGLQVLAAHFCGQDDSISTNMT
jgi:hypothetical protein